MAMKSRYFKLQSRFRYDLISHRYIITFTLYTAYYQTITLSNNINSNNVMDGNTRYV